MRSTTRRIATRAILSSGGKVTSRYAGRTMRSTVSRTLGNGTRRIWTQAAKSNKKNYYAALTGVVLGSGLATGTILYCADSPKVDWDQIKKEILAGIENAKWDDGSYGPILVRLAWHCSGTYDKKTNTGGSNGATMRYKPESHHGANAGLHAARDYLEPIKKRHPEITYADLYTFAGAVAIEHMGGPKIRWRPGRSDIPEGPTVCPPDGRLPDASQGSDHIRNVFYRMGFNDREIVALVGAHALGRAHKTNSGYDGPWTTSPIAFTNEFFVQLLETEWVERKWNGPKQFQDKDSGALMMLPADLALIKDPEFRKYVELYAKDETVFFRDFAEAFAKLLELGVPFPAEKSKGEGKSWWQKLLGR